MTVVNTVRMISGLITSLMGAMKTVKQRVKNMFVKNDKEDMVPYSAFLKIKKKQDLNEISRYNLYTTAAIQGAPAGIRAFYGRHLESA